MRKLKTNKSSIYRFKSLSVLSFSHRDKIGKIIPLIESAFMGERDTAYIKTYRLDCHRPYSVTQESKAFPFSAQIVCLAMATLLICSH